MKFFILAALVAAAAAVSQAPGPSPADQKPGPDEAQTNAALARAQHAVNHKALHHGAGVGTAPYYGVPGTDLTGYGHPGYYGHGYGYGGYGHGYGGYGHGYNGFYGGYYGHPAVYH